jgi:long-chain acyl-CoA synthetase
MDPRTPVDDFRPQWTSFADFLACRPGPSRYLTELDHGRGTRREWTAAAWRGRVGAVAGWLGSRGAGPGSTVATLAGNSADALAVGYACWLLGACYLPLNPQDSAERQDFELRDARPVLLVHGPEQAARAGSLAARQGLACNPAADLPEAGPAPDGPVVERFDRAALRLYTSGTTGEPKGIVLSLGNLLTDLDALRRVYRWHAGTRVLTVLPIHHANALVISSLLPWSTGASTVLCDRFRSDRFWADAAAEGATTASLVPTLLEFLLGTHGGPPDGFVEVLCGAGPLLVDTALAFEDRFGLPVRHLYGLSETTCVSAAMPAIDPTRRREWHSVYGFPSIGPALPHAEMAVLDPDGRNVPTGVRGELAVRGAIVMREYANRPEATADAFRHSWFHAGDEGFWQPGPDGPPAFFITGRLKELIIRGGHNISPVEIDEVLRGHPRVRFALAVPFDNRLYGDEIAGYVVPDGEVTEAELLAWCAQRLDFAHQPKVILFGDDVPYTATGKAKRLELKQRLAPVLAGYRDTQFRRPR